jgi:thioredoxin
MAELLTLASFKERIFDFEANKEWKFKGERPVVIDFFADWCGPCKMVGPVVDKLAEEYKGQIDIYKVDTEAEPELSKIFAVSSIPALLFIPMDSQPSMTKGALPEASFKKAFDELFGIK